MQVYIANASLPRFRVYISTIFVAMVQKLTSSNDNYLSLIFIKAT